MYSKIEMVPNFPPRILRDKKMPKVCKVNGTTNGTVIQEQTAIKAAIIDTHIILKILFFFTIITSYNEIIKLKFHIFIITCVK